MPSTDPPHHSLLPPPEVLARWRRAAALRKTLRQRPDLIEARGGLSTDDLRLLDEWPD